MEMSSDSSSIGDPVAGAARGVTRAAIDYTEEKLKAWIAKFRNKELAFVEDQDSINIAKELRTRPEYEFFSTYIEDRSQRVLFQMGLLLRELETNTDRLQTARTRIRNNYGLKGLHFAQLVQSGSFSRYIASIFDKFATKQQLKFEIINLIEKIDTMVTFVMEMDNVEDQSNTIITRIRANSPNTYIVCSFRSAISKCDKVMENVWKEITTYESEIYQSRDDKIFFLTKIDEL